MGASYGNLRQVTSLMYFMQFKTKRPCSGMHVSNASSSFEVMLTCMPFPGPQIVFVPTVFAIAVFKGFFLEGTMCLFLYVVRGSFHSPWTGTCHFATSGPHSRQLSDFGAIHWPHPPTKTKCPGQGGGTRRLLPWNCTLKGWYAIWAVCLLVNSQPQWHPFHNRGPESIYTSAICWN